MAKKSFLLVSLKESKAKKVAEVISNKTCRKILDYLADKKDATESQMAKDLKIPISTVHYNMKALLTARLVKSDEYHYSSKGKEVNHYYLANQYVIIAPEGEKHAIREKLKSIIPTALIMGFAASIIKLFSGGFLPAAGVMKSASMDEAAWETAAVATEAIAPAEPMMYKAAAPLADADMEEMEQEVGQAGGELARSAVDEAANTVVQHIPESMPAPEIIYRTVEVTNAPEIALWFFIGAVAGVGVYLLVDYIVKRIRDR